jgi:hypothetical protein
VLTHVDGPLYFGFFLLPPFFRAAGSCSGARTPSRSSSRRIARLTNAATGKCSRALSLHKPSMRSGSIGYDLRGSVRFGAAATVMTVTCHKHVSQPPALRATVTTPIRAGSVVILVNPILGSTNRIPE